MNTPINDNFSSYCMSIVLGYVAVTFAKDNVSYSLESACLHWEVFKWTATLLCHICTAWTSEHPQECQAELITGEFSESRERG